MAIITGFDSTNGTKIEGDLRNADIISAEVGLLLKDRASLWGNPMIPMVADMTDSGSDTIRYRLAGLDGYDEFTAVAEGGSASVQAFSDASVTIAIARAALHYQVTDLAALTSFGASDVDPYRLAESCVGSFLAYFQKLVCTAGGAFTSNVSNTGAALSVDKFLDAVYDLELDDNDAPFMAVLSPRQIADLQSSLRSETGPLSFHAPSVEAMSVKGAGYAGSYLGVDLFKSSKVAISGADNLGFLMAGGALGFASGVPRQLAGAPEVIVPSGVPIAIEFERDAAKGLTSVVAHSYMGVSILQDAKGVVLQTRKA